MFIKNNIEVNGISRVVVKKQSSSRVYIRNEDRDWIDQTSGKLIKDIYMCSRIRKLVNSRRGFLGCGGRMYRVWIHNETINLEKKY
jgi:hypothetical protein